MTQNGELGLQSKQVALCGPVKLPLLGRRESPVAFGDMTRNGEGGSDDGVSRGLGFAACAVANDTEHFASQGDGLLPDFEITHASSHGMKMTDVPIDRGIDLARFVSKPPESTLNGGVTP